MNEWTTYRIPSSKDDSPTSEALPLTEVHHIVHLRIARRILEDQQIRAGLIHDESKLNKSRLCVAWLSANYWHNGSIYGTVRFTFDWKRIIEDRKLYWVEAMNYSNKAYRLLVTDRDLSSSKVTPYDPLSDDGPVRFDGKVWLWNGKYTSEFMVESDLSLAEAQALSIVSHGKCRERRNCEEEKINLSTAGAQTLAFILGNGIHCADHLLKTNSDLKMEAEGWVNALWRTLGRKEEFFGGPLRRKESAEDVLLGALALFGSGQHASARKAMRLMKNQDVFSSALTALIRRHFGLPRYQMED